uniref:Uncharacterized protein n=1 Tax=Anguilla anguilla TaxID=7936 RepID=A0A0E9XG13_ANGAN
MYAVLALRERIREHDYFSQEAQNCYMLTENILHHLEWPVCFLLHRQNTKGDSPALR